MLRAKACCLKPVKLLTIMISTTLFQYYWTSLGVVIKWNLPVKIAFFALWKKMLLLQFSPDFHQKVMHMSTKLYFTFRRISRTPVASCYLKRLPFFPTQGKIYRKQPRDVADTHIRKQTCTYWGSLELGAGFLTT